MEYSLHRQLKALYAGEKHPTEVSIGPFRVDALVGPTTVVEIQHSPVVSIRKKIGALLANGFSVLLVRPIIAKKLILARDGNLHQVRRRLSPQKDSPIAFFHDLVFLTAIFPHESLTIELPVLFVEELRRSDRSGRRRSKPFRIEDRKLLEILGLYRLRTAQDLLNLFPLPLPQQFDTQILAEALCVPRWFAQRIAYCLRRCGATEKESRQRTGIRYRLTA